MSWPARGQLSVHGHIPPRTAAAPYPPQDYFARGTPQYRPTKFTTYGYVLSIVKNPSGKLVQAPRPPNPSSTRTRYDACLIRPERSLSVQQIVDGEYFARPDPDAFRAILRRQQEAAMAQQAPDQKTTTFDGATMWQGR